MSNQINTEGDAGPGEIYFMRERDVISSDVSSYVKIGLVRAADDRGSEDRLKEHQTGNPRILYLHEVMKTYQEFTVEGMMHRKLATKRVLGEWFKLSDDELAAAIAMCAAFALTTEEHQRRLDQVAVLENLESTAESIESSDEATQWAKTIVEKMAIVKSCDEIGNSFTTLTATARERGEETRGLAQPQTRKGPDKFDEAGFQVEFPELFAQFQLTKKSIKGLFTLKNKKAYDAEIEHIHPELFALEMAFDEMKAKVAEQEQNVSDLQEIYLNVQGIRAEANWDKEVAQSHLKIMCGVAEGIAGVCAWKRTKIVKVSTDKRALKDAYPVEYAMYISVGDTTEHLVLKKGKGAGVGAGEDAE